MSDLTEFLLARIGEDPEAARDNAWEWLDRHWPAQTVEDDPEWAEVMVDGWLEPARPDTPPAFREFGPVRTDADLREFAANYADHPDYREEWRQ